MHIPRTEVRRAHIADADEMARLSGELGRAELMGPVVDSTARRQGLGRELVGVAENWTLERQLPALTIRSNVVRAESHPFYESLGYLRRKTQHVYRKIVTRQETDNGNTDDAR